MQENPLSLKKKVLFSIVLLLIPLFFLLIIETSLRLLHYGNDLSLFSKSKTYKGYYEANRLVGKRFFSKLPATSSINDLFLMEKPDSCYRIFILGGSTAQGFPYQSGVSFGRILNYRLQDAFPDKLIEVVNLAMVATNSYTQLDFMDEVLEKKPDAILIYAGHNEFYGALGVGSVESGGNFRLIKMLNLRLVHLRTYQLLQHFIAKTIRTFTGDLTDKPTATLMEHIAKDKAIEYNSPLFEMGVKQFQTNLDAILSKAKKQDVPVLIGDLASNIRDNKPFKSMPSDKNPPADSLFQLAQQYDQTGDFLAAHRLYVQAKDLDGIRFRAPEALNEVIHSLGQKYAYPVVPVKSIFEEHSPNGIIGKELMLEHLHPNIDGYFLLADAYFNALKTGAYIAEKWNVAAIQPSQYYRNNWGFTALDSLVADLLVKKLKAGWPFQSDTVVNQFRFTYQPVSYEDSMAYMCIKYNNISVQSQHVELAKHYASLGQYINAFEEYYALIKSEPHQSKLYYEAVEYLLKADRPMKAVELLELMPDLAQNFSAMLKLGQCFQAAENVPLAISSFEKAINLSHSTADKEMGMLLLYNICHEASLQEKSNSILKELVEIDPKYQGLTKSDKAKVVMATQDVKPLLDSALAYARSGRMTEANEVLQRSLAIQETSFAYSMLGSLYFKRDNAISLKYFNKAYQMNPSDENVLNNLCVLSIMKKDFQLATKYLDELKLISNNVAQVDGLSKLMENAKKSN